MSHPDADTHTLISGQSEVCILRANQKPLNCRVAACGVTALANFCQNISPAGKYFYLKSRLLNAFSFSINMKRWHFSSFT